MRKIMTVLALGAAMAVAVPASAHADWNHGRHGYYKANYHPYHRNHGYVRVVQRPVYYPSYYYPAYYSPAYYPAPAYYSPASYSFGFSFHR